MTGATTPDSRSPLTPAALAAVAAGGAAGAGLRHALALAAPPIHGVAWTILAINVVGCFALALLPAWPLVARHHLAMLFAGPGLLGGFTTLSAFAEQSRALIAADRTAAAGLYVAATVTLCLGAVIVARKITSPPIQVADDHREPHA